MHQRSTIIERVSKAALQKEAGNSPVITWVLYVFVSLLPFLQGDY